MEDRKGRVAALKDRLSRYRQMELEIDLQLERLARFEAKYLTAEPKELTGMPPGGNPPGDKLGTYVARKEELENSIRHAVEKQRKEKQYLEGCIGYLRSAREKAILRMRYFDSCSWNDVLEAVYGKAADFDERQESYLRLLHKTHNTALENMVGIMQEREQRAKEKAEQTSPVIQPLVQGA